MFKRSMSNSTSGELFSSLNKMERRFNKITSPVYSLPKAVQKRIKALKRLQLKTFEAETNFYEELHSLEAKYEQVCQPFFTKRFDIINARVEPTDEECIWISDEDDDEEDDDDEGSGGDLMVEPEDELSLNANSCASGVPNFWLQIFKNVGMLSAMIQVQDELLLSSLIDIESKTLIGDRPGFRLIFTFKPNDYFTNAVLTKDYEYKFTIDECTPLDYDGPEIVKCTGSVRFVLVSRQHQTYFQLFKCVIDWKPEMNLTMKKVEKLQRHRSQQLERIVVQFVPTDSFFNFFSPPEVAAETDSDEAIEEILSNDFEVSHFLRDQVIPKAVLFFTGEAMCVDDEIEVSENDSDQGEEMENYSASERRRLQDSMTSDSD